jgi:hypothetical protein
MAHEFYMILIGEQRYQSALFGSQTSGYVQLIAMFRNWKHSLQTSRRRIRVRSCCVFPHGEYFIMTQDLTDFDRQYEFSTHRMLPLLICCFI